MDISAELLLTLGSVIVILAGALAMTARANTRMAEAAKAASASAKQASEALTAQTSTNIQLNNELQEVIRERREWERERRQWERDREEDQQKVDRLTLAQTQLQAALTTERKAREEQGRVVELLRGDIDELKRENTKLRLERDAAIRERDALQDQVSDLRADVEQLKQHPVHEGRDDRADQPPGVPNGTPDDLTAGETAAPSSFSSEQDPSHKEQSS